MLSPDWFARIAVDSLSIQERLSAGLCPKGQAEPPEVASRLKAWQGAAAEGDEALFAARLARAGLDPAGARRLLARPEIPAGYELPEWCRVLRRALDSMPLWHDAALAPDAARSFPYLRPHDPLPFEELFVPFVETARALLSEAGPGLLSSDVLDIFARDLMQRLVEIAARVLAVEFRAFQASRQFDDDAGIEPDSESREQYGRFVAATYRDGWHPLLEENCVMARLLATALAQWVGNVGEFEKRLLNDSSAIELTFDRQKPLGRVVAVATGLSDPHDGGRTVISVEFSSGLKVVYKPRSLGVERAYFDFVAAINRYGTLLPLRILTILDRGDYGWVEFVEHRSCATEEEIRRYYRRSGNLLCLVYALNGSDFHFENLIADGEHPVPIDLETICHQRVRIGGGDVDEMTERLRLSVLATDLLPDPVKLDHQYFDVSAFAHSDAEEGQADVVNWKHVNTDGMDYVCERQPPQPAGNLPKLNGKTVVLDEHTDSILEGFEEAYRFLQERADVLLDENGPLRPMFSHHSRFIYRPTALYSLILQRALHPSYVRDGIDFSLQFEVLARKLIEAPDRPMTWPLIEAEMASLWQLDIPRFTARGDETALRPGPESSIAGCFADSAWNATRAKIGL